MRVSHGGRQCIGRGLGTHVGGDKQVRVALPVRMALRGTGFSISARRPARLSAATREINCLQSGALPSVVYILRLVLRTHAPETNRRP